jgi:hypothetical protein
MRLDWMARTGTTSQHHNQQQQSGDDLHAASVSRRGLIYNAPRSLFSGVCLTGGRGGSASAEGCQALGGALALREVWGQKLPDFQSVGAGQPLQGGQTQFSLPTRFDSLVILVGNARTLREGFRRQPDPQGCVGDDAAAATGTGGSKGRLTIGGADSVSRVRREWTGTVTWLPASAAHNR